MIERRRPKYQSGQQVKAKVGLVNDGSLPEAPPEGVLVSVGDVGEVVRIAQHAEANLPIYLVKFGKQLVIGCLEEEIAPIQEGGADD
ncbi:nitrogen fixation protein NifZ [Bradyrhizobium centrolobii]|uniref:Nitrogen fixation protein NifZ n=2 Tax=Bradyrhizobium TaxID=374 RepID=A0A176ZHG7_9BRAD|nr:MULTISPECIES: nitrogen fixation protein NifZ [Bradyrhizobium]OAF06894.1 nitrogen fixation protein NifZ [Bradyrhizobium centrolobii]OAF19226.1 nitrogen fixation protein NifZ [Bradyrhizobium neotropicale]